LTPIDQGILFTAAGGLGVALSRLGAPVKNFKVVSFLNVWIAFPGIFLTVYLTRGLLFEDLGITAFATIFILISLGLLVISTRSLDSKVRGSVIMTGTFVNSINLPFPILQVLMGSFSYAVAFATVSNMIQIVAAKALQVGLKVGSGRGVGVSLARALPLAAFAAGALLHYTVWPAAPSPALAGETDILVNLLIAANFVYFGISLGNSLRASRSQYSLLSRPFLTAALFRVLIGPILGMGLAIPLGAGSAVYLQMVFQATMPPAITNTVIAGIYGFDEAFSARSATILTPINTAESIGVFYLLRGFL
jgi:predicted permease